MHSWVLLEKDFQGVTFECLNNSSLPLTEGLLRKEDQKWRDMGAFIILGGSEETEVCGNLSVLQIEMVQV